MKAHSNSAQLEDSSHREIHVSYPYPLGATVTMECTNFSVFSANAPEVEIVFFDQADDAQAARVISLDATVQRTSNYWHIFVPEIRSGQLYGYRVDGSHDPSKGHRFDRDKILLDPYARSVSLGRKYSRTAASRWGDNAATCMKSVAANRERNKRLWRSHGQALSRIRVNGVQRVPVCIQGAGPVGCSNVRYAVEKSEVWLSPAEIGVRDSRVRSTGGDCALAEA
jgi:pullulanase/glycogen debranching enzyme